MISSRRWTLATLLLVPGPLWSCGERAVPVGPEAEPQASETSAFDLSRLAVYRDGGQSLTIGLAWKWIGPEGGRLQLLGFEVEVPPGAVTTLTRFSIRFDVAGQLKQYVMAEFGPHNQSFRVPVTLRLPYRGTSAEGELSYVLWWNGHEWVRLDTAITQDGRLEARTDHFSEYGTEDTNRGFVFAGG